jgi:S2P endopeptidase
MLHRDNVQLLSTGFSLTLLVLPAAFVSLASSDLQNLRPRQKIRIIAAGPYHNLVAWLVFYALSYLGLGTALLSLSYRNVSAIGRVIISVESGSALRGYLNEGTVLTALDDVSLSTEANWEQYLISEERPSLGWCVDTQKFTGIIPPA